jgi:hypothetical protein
MAISESERREAIEAALAARDPEADGSERLPWHDDYRNFPIVDLDLSAVVLNPDSHRIQAQLESHPEAQRVREDPFSDQAQGVIAGLLREVDGFEALRGNLDEETQHHAGVVTPAGLLVNANRRAVALRDIGAHYIRVAVLPEATAAEISDLELRLQMQRDFRQSYSFTNRLLFVEELINVQGRQPEEVARALNEAASNSPEELDKGRAKVNQDTRVLTMIRSLQKRSEGRIPLTDFDGQEIAFEELDAKIVDAGDAAGEIASIRELRLLGILTEVPYRDLRRFDAESLDQNVIPWLEEDEVFGAVLRALPEEPDPEQGAEPEGLEILGGHEEDGRASESAEKIGSLVGIIARSRGEESLTLPSAEGELQIARKVAVTSLKDNLREAAGDIESERRHEKRVERPRDRAQEAERKLRLAHEAFERVKDESDFDPASFAEQLARVRERLDAIDAALGEG